MLGIAGYGMWRTRGRRDLNSYLRGGGDSRWFVIGLSVMATQASAITFLSTPGQGYQDGMGFVQNYFAMPLALIIIAAVFLPIYRKLNVYTAYEYLGKRFDGKTRILSASLFLLQRGLGAGITIYAPAIVLSTVLGWSLQWTILCSGLLVIVYTVAGGSVAVTATQKYQIGIIFAGMIAAFAILMHKMPAAVSFSDAFDLAGRFHKLKAVDFSVDPKKRYTLWTGLFGGICLHLSYFGTDQSQVQRYIGASSLREGRLGLMFNAVFKIPMQFFILLIGSMLFVFYQFHQPPVFFNQPAWRKAVAHDTSGSLRTLEGQFNAAQAQKRELVNRWIDARRAGDSAAQSQLADQALAADANTQSIRDHVKSTMHALDPHVQSNDGDYVFITFILDYLPHGLIGLLVAVFFAAALASKSAELNALASTTTVDIYRHIIQSRGDAHYLAASKWFTLFWGLFALGVALFAGLMENLIQASNIVGSVFYGVVLGLFLVAFFMKWIGGTAVFCAAVVAQLVVILLYATWDISYLWYNLIGSAACVGLAMLFQLLFRGQTRVAS